MVGKTGWKCSLPRYQRCRAQPPFLRHRISALEVDLKPVTNEAAYLSNEVARFEETGGLIDTLESSGVSSTLWR
jgi:hypothetical protein